MADIKIENDNRDMVISELGEITKQALIAVGMQAVTDIISQSDFPVDTGLLRNSITFALAGQASQITKYSANRAKAINGKMVIEKGGYSGSALAMTNPTVFIGTNVEYAKYVQYGTSKMAGRDFMFAPLKANLGHYKEILTKYLKEG